jgi:hypothetical protein
MIFPALAAAFPTVLAKLRDVLNGEEVNLERDFVRPERGGRGEEERICVRWRGIACTRRFQTAHSELHIALPASLTGVLLRLLAGHFHGRG